MDVGCGRRLALRWVSAGATRRNGLLGREGNSSCCCCRSFCSSSRSSSGSSSSSSFGGGIGGAATKRGMGVKTRATPDALVALGSDFLLFLGATVLVVPVFKSANQSPVLGYLFAGVVMGQLGLFRNVEEIEKLSELGVLFLLFEMGLELSLDKLRSLAKYAFGMGSLQMLLTTAAFMAVSLPPGHGLMSQLLETVMHAPPSLAEIKTVDEAIVIAVALSLSSSAFVLQLLKEKNELDTKFGHHFSVYCCFRILLRCHFLFCCL